MRCPVLVSRAAEMAQLRDALLQPAAGHGGVWVLRGEAGVGKSRLAATVVAEAEQAGMAVLAGRAVRSSAPMPMRPLGEALLAWLRTGSVPDDRRLAPYLPALGRLAPQFGTAPDDGGSSVMLVGEALLRLAAAIGGPGVLLLIEDLHWADPETLGVLEYVADNVRDVPLDVVATTRPHDAPTVAELLDALHTRGAARVLALEPLDTGEVGEMLGACLDQAAPDELTDWVLRFSAGFPLLVEEVLADLQSSGALVNEDGSWRLGAELSATVPPSFARSVESRLSAVTPVAREVMEAAALLGTEFDWQVVGTALALDDRAVASAIRDLREQRLVVPAGDGFAIRHALTREAVLSTVLPPDRRRLAGALAAAVDAGGGDGEGDAQALAELFETAGDDQRAAEHWLAAARSATVRGALTSAQEALAKGAALAERGGDLDIEIREAELEVHALAGDIPRAIATADALIEDLQDRTDAEERLGRLRLRLARALLAGGRWDEAEEALALAAGDPALHHVLSARLALGREDERAAEERARAALAEVGSDRPEVACEAWEIIGRAARGVDVIESEEAFEEGFRLADRSGLVLWRCRLLALLGSLDIIRRRPTGDRLVAARTAALSAGAIATAARVELDLNMLRTRYFELDDAMAAIENAVEMMGRLRLPDLSVAYMVRALTHGLQGDDDAMAADLARAHEVPHDPAMLAVGIPGHVLGPVALTRGRYDEALDHWASAVAAAEHFRSLPFSTRGLWALLDTVLDRSGDGGAAAREAIRNGPQANAPYNHFVLRCADAIVLGRTGEKEQAAQVFADAEWPFGGREPWMELHARALVARAAAADGWGAPDQWFRQALDGFVDYGQTEAASACRVAMREAGIAVPRRAVGSDRVPAHLQALGVTAREYDVMELVVEGLANKAIADRLFLSVRTVETHVARLLQRTGANDRGELGAHLSLEA
ncbi:AAA family ATPase [Nocardioides humilatus]|uniref:AAA family ATPase n=1 Tax=Nocardioides humilatus TaxID=2607660 RepID=A0A5B1LDW4_9ACTN|nr:LuxR family transcriptional regulator [Nocardioides humilatus]KAA1418636.1 AAA family ATPase [Nocardioides humilatus]